MLIGLTAPVIVGDKADGTGDSPRWHGAQLSVRPAIMTTRLAPPSAGEPRTVHLCIPYVLPELLAKSFKDEGVAWGVRGGAGIPSGVWGEGDEGGQARASGSKGFESHCISYCAWRTSLPPLLPSFIPEAKGIKMGAIIVPTSQNRDG